MCAMRFSSLSLSRQQMSPSHSYAEKQTRKCFEWVMETVCWHNYLSQFLNIKTRRKIDRNGKDGAEDRCKGKREGGRERDGGRKSGNRTTRKWKKANKLKLWWWCLIWCQKIHFIFVYIPFRPPGHCCVCEWARWCDILALKLYPRVGVAPVGVNLNFISNHKICVRRKMLFEEL